MEERIKKIDTVKKCEIFAQNAKAKGREDLAKQAIERSLQIRAEEHGANMPAEIEALQAVYAYEEVLSAKNGKRTRASRTWPMIERHGIIGAVERTVNRPRESKAYHALVEMGLEGYAFEAVIIRHQTVFSQETVEISKQRLSDWTMAAVAGLED
ncbi:hypothetical protein [Microbulbifer variabilis]|uniref:hypothetical protein n=1 Tax=Microbulbifer variabilis TaxID=266805 RepID=UPI001CFF0414|nr:hypothetical protein [Microbulbifer variabilis]